MDLFVAVGILFAIGYAAGFGVRTVSAHVRDQNPRYRPMSSLRNFEEQAWTR